MELFGIGGTEVVLILIIAMVVAGPARMMIWMRTLGQWTAKLRKAWTTASAQLQRELDDAGVDFKVPKDIPSRRAILDELARSSAVRDLRQPFDELKGAVDEVSSTAREAQSTLKSTSDEVKSAIRYPSLKPSQIKPKSPAAPTTPATSEGLGTWAGDKPSDNGHSDAGTSAPSDLGTWGQPRKEE